MVWTGFIWLGIGIGEPCEKGNELAGCITYGEFLG
jgi:hypothetical protein